MLYDCRSLSTRWKLHCERLFVDILQAIATEVWAGMGKEKQQDAPVGVRQGTLVGATIDDVARLAGVSTATVSRALNHPDRVAESTRGKIETAIAQTGYVPNLLAGGLASKRSRLIAAVVHLIDNVVHAETIRSFSRTLRRRGYQVFLGETENNEQLEEELVAAVLSRRPDGIFLTGTRHTLACRRMLLAANIPVVEAWDLTTSPLDVVIGFSYEKIGRAMAEFLLAKGYRQIAVISAADHRSDIRLKSFQETIREKGGFEPLLIKTPSPSTFKMGREALLQLLGSGFNRGGISCSTDSLAHGVLTEAIAQGISVPKDLGVMGFGDQPYAVDTYPALTTVRFDREKIGGMAADILLRQINGEEIPERVIDIGFSIVERDSL